MHLRSTSYQPCNYIYKLGIIRSMELVLHAWSKVGPLEREGVLDFSLQLTVSGRHFPFPRVGLLGVRTSGTRDFINRSNFTHISLCVMVTIRREYMCFANSSCYALAPCLQENGLTKEVVAVFGGFFFSKSLFSLLITCIIITIVLFQWTHGHLPFHTLSFLMTWKMKMNTPCN